MTPAEPKREVVLIDTNREDLGEAIGIAISTHKSGSAAMAAVGRMKSISGVIQGDYSSADQKIRKGDMVYEADLIDSIAL